MYGRRLRQARSWATSVLELSPNHHAQASLSKTARPGHHSWADYKIGVLPAKLWDRGASMFSADNGKGLGTGFNC